MLHLLAAAATAAAGVRLVRRGQDRAQRLSLLAFVIGAATLFAVSGTYHLLDAGTAGRAVLLRLDHAAIWIMIAGSFTGMHGVAFARGPWRGGFLALVWTIAITGLVLKTVFFDTLPEWAGLSLYLALGWLGLASGWALWRRRRTAAIPPLLASGLSYSLGAVYDFAVGPPIVPGIIGAHEVFHVAVVVGAALHARVLLQLLPRSKAEAHAGVSTTPAIAPPLPAA